jgi:hypothetical protein
MAQSQPNSKLKMDMAVTAMDTGEQPIESDVEVAN